VIRAVAGLALGAALVAFTPADAAVRSTTGTAACAGPLPELADDEQPLFRRIAVPGFTDQRTNTAGLAVQDFNRDGIRDLFAIYNDGSMRMLLGRGCLRYSTHRFSIVDSPYTYADPPGGAAIANWADFNDDGFLDAFISHNTDGANVTQRGARPSAGNSLLLSQGAFDRFKEEAGRLGVTNEGAYSRASSIADVDGDGHLDIAVGADQIGMPDFGGTAVQRLYVWREAEQRFEDIGGSGRVPGFGGPQTCDPERDKASPGILLRDVDGDLRPELVQGYHNDMLLAVQAPGLCVTGERWFGLFAWRNTSSPGRPAFAPVAREEAGLGGAGKMRYDVARADYEVVSHGLGLPYVFAADAFNRGRLDLLAIGPTDPEFHVNTDMIAGKFFRHVEGTRFADETEARGLAALNWTYDQWAEHLGLRINPSTVPLVACAQSNRKPTCLGMPLGEHQLYASTAAWGDFDNDGCLDFVLADRHEDPRNLEGLRNILFRNRCDGSFEPAPLEFSGLDTNSVSVEVADLDGDGLLDLVAGAQPSNTYPVPLPPLPDDRYFDKVFHNTGGQGARANHWVEVDLRGLPQRKLLGAQLYLTAVGRRARRFLGRRDYVTSDSYKSGRQPTVHWGLGRLRKARLELRLPDRRRVRVALPCIDRRVVVNVKTRRVSGCRR